MNISWLIKSVNIAGQRLDGSLRWLAAAAWKSSEWNILQDHRVNLFVQHEATMEEILLPYANLN